jgi:hypothetical protein
MYQNRIHNNYHHLLTWLKLFADLSSRSTDWFFRQNFPVFQLYRGVNKFYKLIFSTTGTLQVKRVVTRVTRRMPLVKELPTLPEYPSSRLVFSGVRVARSSVFCKVFYRSLFVLFPLFIMLSVLL